MRFFSRIRRRRSMRSAGVFLLLVMPATSGAFIICWFAMPYPRQRLSTPANSTFVYDRDGQLLRAYVSSDDAWRVSIPLHDISPWLLDAIVAVEDQRFHSHPGVDIWAIGRAVRSNVTERRLVSGASTLTMQVQRMLDPGSRTFAKKAEESFRALQMERFLSKDQILEWYLNLAPFGSNVYGAEAASLRYFGKRCCDLTLAEAALLAGLPQSPSRLRPDRHPQQATKRRNHVLERMQLCGMITPEQQATAMGEPIRLASVPSNRSAHHFCDWIRSRIPGRGRVVTTLDSRIQNIAEQTLRQEVRQLNHMGVNDGAVVVVENRTGAVRALIGAIDYEDKMTGQVNGASAPRSPGSLLKPFIYGLAFEKGLITPGTILHDDPISLAGYSPRNFDRQFVGPIRADHALAASVNVPAIKLLRRVGLTSTLHLLRNVGITTLGQTASHYGLSLAIGSVEISLLEMTQAYSVLARLGEFRSLKLEEDASVGQARQILSPEACYLVIECLSDPDRTRAVWPALAHDDQPHVAWKTGTSNGYRDGWCIAFGTKYTVGVRLGDPRGHPKPGYLGKIAAGIALPIYDAIASKNKVDWYARPRGLHQRQVCANCGLNPRSNSNPLLLDWFISTNPGGASCCCDQRYARKEILFGQDEKIEILSPSGSGNMLIPAGGMTNSTIALKAYVSDRRNLSWFVDSGFIGSTTTGTPIFWSAKIGHHEIVCCDNLGNSSSIMMVVKTR